MKKIYKQPETKCFNIEVQLLMEQSLVVNKGEGSVTNSNSTQFSREGGWDYDD